MSVLIPDLPGGPVLQFAVAPVPGDLGGRVTAQADAAYVDEVALPHHAVHVPRHLGLSRRICNSEE